MPEKPNGASAKFDTGLIRELAAILRDADLGEIEVQQGELHIRLARQDAAAISYAAPGYAPPAPAAAPAPAPAAAESAATRQIRAGEEANTVKSPMVGTVYLQPEKDSASYVKVGDSVAAGAVLLLVEAMKTFNQVTAPKAGKIKTILVGNEQPVEFGEPLMVIE